MTAAIKLVPEQEPRGSTHDLWIGAGSVLTVRLDRSCNEFPPERKDCAALNQTIQGLARAAKAVIYQADNDSSAETSFQLQPLEDIADAIILLSQLSEAVRLECQGGKDED